VSGVTITADTVQAAIRALPHNSDTLQALLIAVECYASDLYRLTKDGDVGAVADALTEAFADFDASTQPLEPMTREDWRDDQAGMDAYREVA